MSVSDDTVVNPDLPADFQGELAYWDLELSLKGYYPQVILNRLDPKRMRTSHQTAPAPRRREPFHTARRRLESAFDRRLPSPFRSSAAGNHAAALVLRGSFPCLLTAA